MPEPAEASTTSWAEMGVVIYPCLCLCLGLSQMTRTAPWRLMILQRSHIFLTDALTFIVFDGCSSARRRAPKAHWMVC